MTTWVLLTRDDDDDRTMAAGAWIADVIADGIARGLLVAAHHVAPDTRVTAARSNGQWAEPLRVVDGTGA